MGKYKWSNIKIHILKTKKMNVERAKHTVKRLKNALTLKLHLDYT